MSIAVIQGASGGLGLNLTRHILANTSLKVYALTHRSSSDVEKKILSNAPSGISDRLSVLGEVDVREERGLEDVASTIKEREGKGSIRLVACLAGIVRPVSLTLRIALIGSFTQRRVCQLSTPKMLWTHSR